MLLCIREDCPYKTIIPPWNNPCPVCQSQNSIKHDEDYARVPPDYDSDNGGD